MTEIPFEYFNKIASQLITVSSLLTGFSIAITANLLVDKTNNRLTNNILKAATIASGSFLVTVFAMTKIVMITTQGHPIKIVPNDILLPEYVGVLTFLMGIIALSVVIILSGWTKSKRTGIFTTVVGIITFLLILSTLIQMNN